METNTKDDDLKNKIKTNLARVRAMLDDEIDTSGDAAIPPPEFFQRARRVIQPPKREITIMLDDPIIEYFHNKTEAGGSDYGAWINSALRYWVIHQQDGYLDPDKRTLLAQAQPGYIPPKKQ